MRNNKGFSLVELLAVVAIMGILMGIGISAYARYIDKTKKEAREIFNKSIVSAAEEYAMDHPGETEVTVETLIEEQYLEKPGEKVTDGEGYKGKVIIEEKPSESGISTYSFTVNVCLNGDSNNYTYTTENDTIYNDKACKAEPYAEIEEILDNIPTIKVLNVYPTANADKLASWMNTYGKGKITVDKVTIEDFNSNPGSYLKKENGKLNYDEIVFGFWDCNASKDLSKAAAKVVDSYLSEGGAAIFGHDTITSQGCGTHTYFNSLAHYINIEPGKKPYTLSGKVKIVKKGIFTSYPYDIGDVGTVLTIPNSHVYGQTAHGNIWLTFDGNDDPYLSTYGNNAFIQTGHSSGQATPDEQKIIANIIFYMVAKQYVNG